MGQFAFTIALFGGVYTVAGDIRVGVAIYPTPDLVLAGVFLRWARGPLRAGVTTNALT